MYQALLTRIGFVILSIISLLAGTFEIVDANPHFKNSLADTSWHLVEFQSMDDSIGVVRPKSPSLYALRLKNDGTVEMRLNCNSARGQWSIDPGGDGENGRFEFGSLTVTHTKCSPPDMGQRIAIDAQYIRGYFLKNGRLYLSLMADAGIYVWERVDRETLLSGPPAPEEGGPRNWEVNKGIRGLNLRAQPTVNSEIQATYDPGTILDNLGCQSAEGRIWCDVQKLGGGPRGYVASEFLKPAVSPNGMVMTGIDDSALLAGQGIFDATGTIPCAQYRGQPMTQCEFGVARSGGGYATVVVNKPDGIQRAIFFRMGNPIGADTSQADGYPEFIATKDSDLHFIHIGNERYEVPDVVIFGD